MGIASGFLFQSAGELQREAFVSPDRESASIASSGAAPSVFR
jgi:hypothetical protein